MRTRTTLILQVSSSSRTVRPTSGQWMIPAFRLFGAKSHPTTAGTLTHISGQCQSMAHTLGFHIQFSEHLAAGRMSLQRYTTRKAAGAPYEVQAGCQVRGS